MIVELPFLNRFLGRTPRDLTTRWLVARDKAQAEVPEVAFQSFDLGSRSHTGNGTTNDNETLERDGKHWAIVTPGRIGLGITRRASRIEAFSPGTLFGLMDGVDMTRFFESGVTNTPARTILKHTPAAKLVDHSERDGIVERMREWAAENLLVSNGHLYARVHEPSLVLFAHEFDNTNGRLSLVGRPDHLTPWGSFGFTPGVHFPLDAREEMQYFASEHPRITGHLPITRGYGPDPMLAVESGEAMHERGVVSVASAISDKARPKGESGDTGEIRKLMATTSLSDPEDRSDDQLDRLAELVRLKRNVLDRGTAISAGLVGASWQDRPVRTTIIDILSAPRA